MRIPLIHIVTAGALAIGGLGCRKEEPRQIQILRWVETADPIQDAKKALASGDHRLRAVHGLMTTVPGTNDQEISEIEQSYGINPIDGTTDGLVNPEHGRLVRIATQYAESYNRHILKSFKPSPRP